ncbi:MAG: hypothetical protein ACE15C_11755 [Phycisphaerae bacterium]
MAALSSETPKPVLLTADLNIYTRNPVERKALAGSGLTVVFFRRGFHKLDFHTQAVKILTIWPEITRETARCAQPTAFEVTPAARKVQRIGLTANL